MEKDKRCVIIGSGLGGLSTASILQKNGYHVTVLEQNVQIGGCLQCFRRHGAKFETGMHYIGSADEGQSMAMLMRYMGIYDGLTLQRLDTSAYDVVSLHGKQYCFANGKEAFIAQMCLDFPCERAHLEAYYDLVKSIASASSLKNMASESASALSFNEYMLRSINDVLDEITPNETLRRVLAGCIPLIAAERDKTPFSTQAFIFDFYNTSAFRIVGGSDHIAQLLSKTIQNDGGTVITSAKAVEIVCDDYKAVGVRTQDERFFPADVVIAAIHPVRMIEMVHSPLLRNVYKNRVASLKNTIGGFSLYLHFKPGTVPYMNSNYYWYRDDTPWGSESYMQVDWPKGYLYMHFCDHLNPQFATSAIVISYMRYEDVEQWYGTAVGRRGDDYADFKHRHAERLLDALYVDFPQLRGNILDYDTSTPLTYQDYTGTVRGGMYGLAKDIAGGQAGRVSHRTKIPNLFLAGQNVNSHGMQGVMVGTFVTCSELVSSHVIYKQIMEANGYG